MSETGELSDRLGRALGDQYVVERTLGEGGFAVVFLVRDVALKRRLAVKVLSPEMITSKSVLERFRREAETVAQLAHPNIVPLFFIGARDELLYLAMQFVDGGSIADRIVREHQLPVDDAVRVITEVASALAHAHARGVIHRDIKPANVLIDGESGRALVTDFGIARTADSSSLTATGMMIGTAAYVSPEQVTGEPTDHRVDIFALGVMAYEMLAGKLPFDAPTPSAALMKRLGGPPTPLADVRTDVPDWLSDTVQRCLAAVPAERFATADDVVRALRGERVSGVSGTSRTKPARQRSRISGALIIAGLIVAVGLGTWILTHSGGKRADTLPAPLSSEMATIPAGDYPIGSNSASALHDNGVTRAVPAHVVHLNGFSIGRTEVTVGAFKRYADSVHVTAPWSGSMPDSMLPVTGVSWAVAMKFCAWKYGARGRLPTEEEWEATARGALGREFPWGNDARTGYANTRSAAVNGLAPVGSFPRGHTPEGVADLIGNAWEWTSSQLRAYPGGTAIADSFATYRVIRGGAFDTADSIATAWKRGYLPEAADSRTTAKTGFRCVVG